MSLHDDITKKYQQILFEQQVSAGAEGEDPSEGTLKKKKKVISTTTTQQQKSSSGVGAEGDARLLGVPAATTPAPQIAPQQTQAQSPYSGIASDLSQQVMNGNPLGFASTLANWAGQQKMPQQAPQISRGLASTAMNPSGAPTPTPVGLNGTVAINSNQQSPNVMRATNPMQARQMQQNALNPSGAFTPVAVGLDGKTAADRPNPLAQQQSPSLWQRVKNFFGGNPTYSSGYTGNNPGEAKIDNLYNMQLQKQNAARAAMAPAPAARPTQGVSGAGAEGDASLIRAAPSNRPVPQAQASPRPAPQAASTAKPVASPRRDTRSDRQKLQDMGRQLPPGNTTTTRNGNTTTTTTTSSGKFVGGKLIGPDGRAVNPADQADVDAANEMKKRMQQSGGAAGGAGISGVKTFSGKPSGTSTPARPVQSRATKAVSSPQARPTGTSQTRSTGRTTTRQQPSRKPYVRGAGAEGEL